MIEKSKIIFCIDSPGLGGSEINAFKFIDYFRARYEIYFLVNPHASPHITQYLKERGLKYEFHFSKNDLKSAFLGIFRASKISYRFRKNLFIVWSHHLNSNRWLQFVLALTMRKFIVVEQLLPTNYDDQRKNSKLTIPLKRFIGCRSVINVICGHSQIPQYRSIFGLANVIAIPNSRSINEINSRIKILKANRKVDTQEIVVSCVGRLTSQKDQGTLIKALSLLKDKSLKLILVGDGEDRPKLEGMLREFKIEKAEITGFVSDIYPFLAMSDIFVLPSIDEGLPGALIEAMAAEVPCIATNIPGNNELIVHHKTGLLVPIRNAMALAEAISFYIDNPDFYNEIATNALSLVRVRYDDSVSMSIWGRLLEQSHRNLS